MMGVQFYQMGKTTIENSYPNVWNLLSDTEFTEEAVLAAAMETDVFQNSLEENSFRFTSLLCLLCGAIVPKWKNVDGDDLERNLKSITEYFGLEKVRSIFKDKLLNPNKDALEDTCYEISVTAKACRVLDDGSVELEKPIAHPYKTKSHLKNSDIYGHFRGAPVRVEVTVLHEKSLFQVNLDYDEIMKSADLDVGFQAKVDSEITHKDSAEDVRALIELLSDHHKASGGSDVEIDGVKFKWENSKYNRVSANSAIESIRFNNDKPGSMQYRDISYPTSSRIVTPHYLRDELGNPEGVYDMTDLPEFEGQHPVSKKIREMLEIKLGQCESGIINVVAFGVPRPSEEDEVQYALHGAPFAEVVPEIDKSGHRFGGEATLRYASKAPFNDPNSLTQENRDQFIEPFRKLSAVWRVRFGSWIENTVFVNPNADVPMPSDLKVMLEQ